MKVLFVTNVAVPYRVDFFNEFGKKADLTVIYDQTQKEQTHRSKAWFSRDASSFSSLYLYEDIKKWKNPFRIIRYLKMFRKDCIILSGFTHSVIMVSIIWLWLHRIPFIIAVDGGLIKYHGRIYYINTKQITPLAQCYKWKNVSTVINVIDDLTKES